MSYKPDRDSFPQQGGANFPQQGVPSFPQQQAPSFPQQTGPSFPQQSAPNFPQQAGPGFAPPQGPPQASGFAQQGGARFASQQTNTRFTQQGGAGFAPQGPGFQQGGFQQGSNAFAQRPLSDNPITDAFEGPPPPGTSGKHHIAEAVGTVLTGGRAEAGTKGYLAAYLKQLEENPLRTKMLTAGTLAGAQELIASWLAKDRNKHGNYFTSRVPKMAAYGALVSAPLGHFLIWCLQKAFHDKTSLRAKIMQILVSNLIIAPIQNTVYLTAMALIAGARTYHQVRATVRVGFWKVMRVSWITSPICLAFAQKFLPENAWVPFFNLVSFIIGTYINTVTKKRRLAALRKKHFGDGPGRSTTSLGRDDYPPPPSVGPSGPQY